jgi:hypothetical protein
MSFGGGGRSRVGTRVYLNVYDLAPINDYLYPIGCGLHHSGVEILGSEYSFASGAGIFKATPKEAPPPARFREQIDMGLFDGGQAELRVVISELRDEWGPIDYNLIRRNCNHFANALCWTLLKKTIPGHINRLADFGVCCSCLLPRSLIDNAPVGDPNQQSSASNSSFAYSSRQQTQMTPAFSGTGAKVGGSGTSDVEREGLLNRYTSTSSKPSTATDDLTDRREKARKAAMARLERSAQQQDGKDEKQN